MKRIKEILLESDLSLASFLLGLGLIFWGLFAINMAPTDFFSFADSMRVGTGWFWLANYLIGGAGFIAAAYYRFPPGLSLFVGTHACLVWTWIAVIRGYSNITSGVTLNVLVVVMGLLLTQRSGKK